MPRRHRRARRDAKISSITKMIAKILEIPRESIRFVQPTGRQIRSTAKVSALRKAWKTWEGK